MADKEFTNINGIKVCDQTARNNIPTKTSQLENDSDYATITQVNQAIDNAQLGGGEVDLSGYVTKETGNANQITFADGQTFQAKLDAGTLKGDKGEQGLPGEQGPQGEAGPQGPAGANGQDGLTTTISVNGTTYTHVHGVITLPNYPSSTGDSLTDEQISTAINNYLAKNPITVDNIWTDIVEGEVYEVQAPAKQIGITAVFTQGETTIYADTPLDSLKQMLVVTKKYNDNTTEVTTEYSLTGELVAGTSTITVVYETFSTTFNVTVSERPTAELTSITAVYNQTAIVTTSTPLDDLKSEIVVTANYSDGTTANISDYALSGVLVAGTSTVTITYEGKTTTIDVNVIADSGYTTNNLAGYYDLTGYADDNIGELYTGEDYTDSKSLYALDLTESSGVDAGLVVRAYVKVALSSFPDVTLTGFENREYRSCYIGYMGGEGLVTKIGINSISYPFSIEWYGKFCGGMSSPTVDMKDTYDYPLELFSSRGNINNISSAGSAGSLLTLNDSSTLKMSGSIGQGNDTITLSKPIDKDVYHHFVVCYNNSLFQLYVDGEMIGSSTVAQNSQVNMISPMTSGVMKMFRVYKSILSSTEVSRNYNDVLSTFGGGN